MLYNIDLFRNMAEVRKFTSGEIIYQEDDDTQDSMYLLFSGCVNMYKDYQKPNEKKLYTAEDGDFLGEMTLFLGQKRTATAVAVSDIIVLEINHLNVLPFIRREPDAALALLKILCVRINYLSDSDEWKYLQYLEPISDPKEDAKKNPAQEPAISAETLAENEVDLANSSCLAASEFIPTSPSFLAGHKTYRLPINHTNNNYIYIKNMVCPVCNHSFQAYAVRHSKLIAEHTELDLRIRYKNMEPLHYDVLTCPHCWYSALTEMFSDAAPSHRQKINQVMINYKAELGLLFGLSEDTMILFSSYYLALQCIPICFPGQHLQTGKLWIKLSRLYDDCGDKAMQSYAASQALSAYRTAYEKQHIPSKQMPQLSYIIGELSYRFHQIADARKFLLMAKIDKEGSAMIRQFAEDKLEKMKKEYSSK